MKCKSEKTNNISKQFQKVQVVSIVEALSYLLKRLFIWLQEYISQIIMDSEVDPQYSAVTLNNEIICYNCVASAIEPNYHIRTVQEFFLEANYSESDYMMFEIKRAKESSYYIGKQFAEEQ